VVADRRQTSNDLDLPCFRVRLKVRILDPAVAAGPPAVAALCLFRLTGLIAALPYWLIVVVVLGAQAASVVAAALWAERPRGWHLTAYVGVVMGVIGVVAYSTGWGPILALGFIFGAAYVMQLSGSAATRPAIVWVVVFMSLGQLAISMGIAPTLISKPLVYGLTGLGLLGVLLTIGLLGQFMAARERSETELRSSEGRFKALVQNASEIIIVVDDAGMAQYVSPAFERILGIAPAELEARPAFDLLHTDDLARMRSEADDALHMTSDAWQTDLRLQHADGSWRWFEATVTDHRDDPDVLGVVANLHDISARRQAAEALREAHERFQAAFENAPIGMAMKDLEGRILRANPAYGRIVGHSADDLVTMNVHELTHIDDRDASRDEMRRVVSGVSDSYRIEKRYYHAEGHDIWVSVSVSCVRDRNRDPLYLIGQIEDITERRALRERLAHAAIHDPLTGLPNRVLFLDRLDRALSRAVRHHRRVAVIFLDLDRFKLVNDSMGHDTGDRLLEAVADRLKLALRPSDTVARFGGDEFVVLCDEVDDQAGAVEVAERLRAMLAQPIVLADGEIFVTASLGIALSGTGHDSAAVLLRDADAAMYTAKEAGPGQIQIHQPHNEATSIRRLRTSNELHRALERGELELHYQPFVDLHTETMVGLEALVRWRHPARGLLLPTEFIFLAEDSGLIVPLGRWVLEEACRQGASWIERRAGAGADDARLNISVNVSARQMADGGFPATVEGALTDSGLDPDKLWLEITESTLMGYGESTTALLGSLRDLGVHLEIDDFGTGYSSLSYLKQFPVDALKVDRSFVDEIEHNSGDLAIIRAIIALGETLGLSVIAEGVERPTQASELRALGCFLAQGFLYGTPQPAYALDPFPADDLSAWLPRIQTPARRSPDGVDRSPHLEVSRTGPPAADGSTCVPSFTDSVVLGPGSGLDPMPQSVAARAADPRA
jgi:diguanylate cyclase (GGDEF)-like protein/PAS domain S-box-containing protein